MARSSKKQIQRQSRRTWTPQQKVEVLKKHFGKSRLTDTCDEFRVHPNLLNTWLKAALESAYETFTGDNRRDRRKHEREKERYESELARKNRIIAELTGEVLDLKKPIGEA